jgi:peptide/nickel transport system substrate-binding protein
MNDFNEGQVLHGALRRGLSRRSALAGAAALGLGAPALLGGRAASGQESSGGTLTVAVQSPICGLDPPIVCGYPSGPAILFIIANRLVSVDTELQLHPDLAESWEASPDGLSYTFKLRQGVTFHDGTPFNASAIQAHFDHSRDPELAFGTAAQFPQVTSIEYPDDYTVVFGLDEPFGPFVSYFATYLRAIMSPTVYAEYDGLDVGLHPVGTGPYMVSEFEPNVRLVLKRFDNYFGGRPALDEVIVIPAPQPSARANLLRTGQVDVAEEIPIEELADLQGNPDLTVIQKRSIHAFGVNFNLDVPPFEDVRVRQAFNYGVDKQTIVDAIFGGAASVLDSPLAEPIVGHAPIGAYPYDPERAKALLAEAGWEDLDGDGVVEKDGEPLRPTFNYTEYYSRAAELAQAVQGDLRNIGIDVQLQVVEGTVHEATVLGERGTNTIALHATSFNPSNGDATRQLLYMFLSNPETATKPAEGNWGWYSNPQVDAALRAARQEVDQATRDQFLAEAQALIMEDAPWLWLHAPDLLVGVRNNVQGVDVFPMSFLDLVRASKS